MTTSHFDEMARIVRAPDDLDWLDERPDDQTCECGAVLEPSKCTRREKWLRPPAKCFDCEQREEREAVERSRRRKAFEDAMASAGIPKRPLAEAKRLEIRFPTKPMVRFSKMDPSEGRSLYLHGPTGTGKTLQSCLTLRAFMFHWIEGEGRNVTGRYVHLGDAIERHKRTYGDKTAEPVDWSALERCDLLVVDDLTTERGTDHNSEIIGNLIDYRYREMKSTIFVSNVAPRELDGSTGAYDNRVSGRILEMCGGDNLLHIQLTKMYRTGAQNRLEVVK